MTQQVQTSGFQVPNSAPGSGPVIDGGSQNIPPGELNPGFVNPNPQPVAPVAAVPAAQPSNLDASIAALLAALQTQQPAPVPAQPDVTQAATPGKLNTLDVSTLEDPILRSMATIMQTVGQGLDMDRVFGKALEHGDASLLDAAYLREKGGANAAQLQSIAEGIVQAVNAQAEAVTKEIHGMAGGASQWDASVAAFNKAAPPELRQVVAMMLDSEKRSQISAGAKLVVEYAKSSGIVPNVSALIQNNGTAASAAQALNKEGFQSELRKLNPNSREYQAQRESLFARRQQGRQLGM
jgi:hypothetical protein